MIKAVLCILTTFIFFTNAFSQELTQTIRGKVVDEITEYPLVGATVQIKDSEPTVGAITDINGEFSFSNITIGRKSFLITYMGYEDVIVSDILVHSGKSVFFEVRMKESLERLDEIVVMGGTPKHLPINKMATVSARSITIEESQRFAGSLDDPGRMVSAFAGVTSTDLGQNTIIIRGNAPKGVQWRMEGIEIPSPSHFAGATVTGGGFVTLLSNQVLANSDFLTGAFPSEYGNALSGVFDMNLRKGNNEKAEHTLQAGLLGLDVSSEGPFKKGGNSSYLFNYRYSALGLIDPILPDETNTIRYQDLSFKLHFQPKKFGKLSIWGIGGKDYGRKNEELLLDQNEWETEDDREDYEYGFLVGAMGFQHKVNFGTNTMLETNLAASVNDAYWDVDRLTDDFELVPNTRVDNMTSQFSFSTVLNNKFSSKLNNKTGILAHHQVYDIEIGESPDKISSPQILVDEDGTSNRVQFFSQSRIRLGNTVSLNLGFHGQYFGLNDQLTFEPRAGFQYVPSYRHRFGLGYGNHSQQEDLKIYFVQNSLGEQVNNDLRLTRAHHFVFSYDWLITDKVRLKFEPYYQFLYDVPVEQDSSFSMLNFSQDWFLTENLVNEGKGRNFGVDLTLERFLKNNFYYLFTGSVFKSEYKGGDGIWRNTRYDRGYAFNILAGKEWRLGKGDNKWLRLNARFNLMGGLRYSPVDEMASITAQEVIFDETNAYNYQAPAINYLDLTISYRKNRKKYSSIWSLQVKNMLGHEDFGGYDYNFAQNRVDESKSTIVIPNLSYKIEF